MRDTDYAFCVARIRANETRLLDSDFINRLVDSSGYNEAVRMLSEKGWMDVNDTISQAAKKQSKELWQLLSESVPDKKELDCLCTLNDYFNIKTAVKCALTGLNADDYFVFPTSVDLHTLTKEIKTHNFNALPGNIADCAEKAYDIANKTENGQNADAIIDRAALEILNEYAQRTKNKILSEVFAFTVDTSAIKIALRCAYTNKNEDFADASIPSCSFLERDRLIAACTSDIEALYSYLLSGRYSEAVELYRKSPVAFDKWCDDKIIDIVKGAKYTAFGFGPVCAFNYAKLTEIKTVRIILTSKLSGVSKDVIMERVRASYA